MTPQLSTKYVFTITARIGEVTETGELAQADLDRCRALIRS